MALVHYDKNAIKIFIVQLFNNLRKLTSKGYWSIV